MNKRYSATSIALLASGHFFSDFYATFLPGLMPMLIDRLSLSLTISGLLVMLFAVTSNILQPIFGYYVDKNGCAGLVLLTVPFAAVFMGLAAAANTVFSLFAFIILAGLGTALFHPLGSALLARVATEQNKGLAMSVFIGAGNIGVALAPSAIMMFVVYYGAERVIWLAVPAGLISAAFYWLGLHKVPLATPPGLRAARKGPAWYRSSALIKLNLVMGLRSWPQAAIPSFLAVWLVQKGFSASLAATMLTVFLMGGAVGSVCGGYIGDRLGRKPCVISALALCVPALYVFFTSTEVSMVTWVMLGISGAALQATLPSSIVWAQDLLPENAAMASGMMLGLSFGIGGLGAAVTGALADVIGLEQALLWTVLPLALGALITLSIPDNTPAKQDCSL